jgi:hypothetical protein
MAASLWLLLCSFSVCHRIRPLFNFPLLWFCENLWFVQIMVRYPPTDRMLMERILLAARLQFGMLPVGVENAQVNRVCRRWFLRIARVLDSPWCGLACRRLRLLRRMTILRTLGVGTCLFWFDSEVGVLSSKGVYSFPQILMLFLSLSFGCVVDWREQFLTDVALPLLPHCYDPGLAHFVHHTLARTFG